MSSTGRGREISTDSPEPAGTDPDFAGVLAQLRTSGQDGAGVAVAILDTLPDEAHPALAGRCAPARIFDPGWPTLNVSTASSAGSGGDCTHGTATASVVAAAAPAARIAPLVVLSGGPTCARLLLALDWLVAQPAPPPVICMALGVPGPACVLDPLLARLAARGCLLLAAVGNYGAGTALAPAVSPHVLAVGVGSEDGTDRPHDVRAYSGSSLGCAYRPEPKPDVVVPIGGMRAARPGGGDGEASGTSAAVARLAGTCAVLAGLRPDWPAAALAAVLTETAVPPREDHDHRVRFGTVDLVAATAALARRRTPPKLRAQPIGAAPGAPWPQVDRFLRVRLAAAASDEPVEAALRFADRETLALALRDLAPAAEGDAIRLRRAPIVLVRAPAARLAGALDTRGLIAAQSAWANLALLRLDRIGRR